MSRFEYWRTGGAKLTGMSPFVGNPDVLEGWSKRAIIARLGHSTHNAQGRDLHTIRDVAAAIHTGKKGHRTKEHHPLLGFDLNQRHSLGKLLLIYNLLDAEPVSLSLYMREGGLFGM
jgi:hypothetical protein